MEEVAFRGVLSPMCVHDRSTLPRVRCQSGVLESGVMQ